MCSGTGGIVNSSLIGEPDPNDLSVLAVRVEPDRESPLPLSKELLLLKILNLENPCVSDLFPLEDLKPRAPLIELGGLDVEILISTSLLTLLRSS
jgi:hypothetical protein